ncbi:WD40/YVTN/BNR-like repeat-containing protein [Mesonia aestuariivivens]|uniref:Oxidoreductase n=1 Tax=Mesonia aestuariivivens TaxID=2796128 RepID=A0ABS6W0T2_9FLAO|nr:oxidoreductase [Mesonia aestuariivivens]MBW2961452.1 oxidoreductase [Mesonia aestuariivivens]
MRIFTLLICVLSLTACVNVAQQENAVHQFTSVKVEGIFNHPVSIRALKISPEHIFYAGSKGSFGYLNMADHSVAFMGNIAEAPTKEFRAIGSTGESDFILSAGNPAQLYKVNYFGKRKLVYEEKNEKVFYDAMGFWNENEGIAIGDPTDDCMSILITRDGGESWKKISCDELPKAIEGEAAFAASNTNISIVGDQAWFVSGGKVSRIYNSKDKGESWSVSNLPIIQGKETTGAYSLDFYNQDLGVAFGGDYTKPNVNVANKIFTKNGGESWDVIAKGEGPGYRSCVKFVPNSGGQEIVALGFKGISYSADYGATWKQISDEPFYTFTFVNEFVAYAAGNNRISRLTFIENTIE